MVKVDSWDMVLGTTTWYETTLIFDPLQDLEGGTTYQVNVTTLAQDDSDPGNTLAEGYSWNFSTAIGDIIPPKVMATGPAGGEWFVPITTRSITITFSEIMDQTWVLRAISLSPSVKGTIVWEGNTVTIFLQEDLDYDTEYTIVVNATLALDLAGNALDGDGDGIGGDDYSFTFRTAQAPQGMHPLFLLALGGIAVALLVTLAVLTLLLLRSKKGPEEEKGESMEEGRGKGSNVEKSKEFPQEEKES